MPMRPQPGATCRCTSTPVQTHFQAGCGGRQSLRGQRTLTASGFSIQVFFWDGITMESAPLLHGERPLEGVQRVAPARLREAAPQAPSPTAPRHPRLARAAAHVGMVVLVSQKPVAAALQVCREPRWGRAGLGRACTPELARWAEGRWAMALGACRAAVHTMLGCVRELRRWAYAACSCSCLEGSEGARHDLGAEQNTQWA